MSNFAVTVRAALKPYQLLLPGPVRAVIEAAAEHIDALQLRVDHLNNELEKVKEHVQSMEHRATD